MGKLNVFARCFLFIIPAVLLINCGTILSVRPTSPGEGLEGRDYTIQFSVTNREQVDRVILYYRVNASPFKSSKPQQEGTLYEQVVPGTEMVPGMLEYYAEVYDREGKVHKSAVTRVRVLSRAEAKAQAESTLVRRCRLTAPESIAVNHDLEIYLSVSGQREDMRVVLFYRHETSAAYRERILQAQGGVYRTVITASELSEGAVSFYFIISEGHVDFGQLEVFYPEAGNARPAVVRMLGRAEIEKNLRQELYASVIHTPPREAPVTVDLEISLSINTAGTKTLRSILLGEPAATLCIGKKGLLSGFRTVPMTVAGQATLSGLIDRHELADGVNAYYFTVTAVTRDYGPIEITVPAQGAAAPFTFRIVGIEEIRERRRLEYLGRLSHTPLTESVGMYGPVVLELEVADAPAVSSGVLHFKKASQRTYRDVALSGTPKGLAGTIVPADLEEGMMVYYFTVALGFPDVGEIILDYPVNYAARPFSLTVAGKQALLEQLQDDLARRTHHTPPSAAEKAADLELKTSVQIPKAGTEVSVFYRREKDREWKEKHAAKRGSDFVAVLSIADLAAGYDRYYISVSEPHPQFGKIGITLPAQGKAKPFILTVNDQARRIRDGIVFEPIKTVESAKSLKVHLQIKQPVDDLEVAFLYRVHDGRGAFSSLKMPKSGINFFADIDAFILKAGLSIDYYFMIKAPSLGLEMTYPDAGQPFSFDVQDKDKPGGKDKDKK